MNEVVSRQLLVLGAGLNPQGELTTQSHDRVSAAYQFYDENGADSVVFSGGYRLLRPENSPGSSEALRMADLAVKEGLPADIIKLEQRSFNTLTNITCSAPLLNEQETGIVTHG